MRKFVFLLGLIPLNLFSQWKYIGRIDDNCSPPISNNYSFSNNFNTGLPGSSYKVYRNGTLITSGEGIIFGCCSVDTLKVFTDSIVFLIVNGEPVYICSRTIDAGNTWTFFDWWFDQDIADIAILNKNSGYVISRGVYYNGISIRRISDINSRYLISDDTTINTSITEVYLKDTIFGDSYCPNIQNIGFRIQKNGIYINYHISIFQLPLSISVINQIDLIRISPNPTDGKFVIESEDAYSIKIYNNFGQLLQTSLIKKGNTTIDLANYNAGLYFISFYNKNMFLTTKKVIKK